MRTALESSLKADNGLDKPGTRASRISVIVPVSERAEDLVTLYQEYATVLRRLDSRYEFVFVFDPRFEDAAAGVLKLAELGEPILTLHVGQATGEADLVKLGLTRATGAVIITLPPYYRVEAASLEKLHDGLDAGSDLVTARRWPRRDSWINKLQSWIFHTLTGRIADLRLRDIACGVRLMRREVLEETPLYGDFYRFFPMFAAREGFRVEEIKCQQHERDVSVRVYRPGVYLRRLLDLLGLFFLLRFTERPLRFFGLVGLSLSASGAIVLTVLAVQRLLGRSIADRPLLLLGVLLLVLGVQAISLGLVGEMIVHLHAPRRKPYRLARVSRKG